MFIGTCEKCGREVRFTVDRPSCIYCGELMSISKAVEIEDPRRSSSHPPGPTSHPPGPIVIPDVPPPSPRKPIKAILQIVLPLLVLLGIMHARFIYQAYDKAAHFEQSVSEIHKRLSKVQAAQRGRIGVDDVNAVAESLSTGEDVRFSLDPSLTAIQPMTAQEAKARLSKWNPAIPPLQSNASWSVCASGIVTASAGWAEVEQTIELCTWITWFDRDREVQTEMRNEIIENELERRQ